MNMIALNSTTQPRQAKRATIRLKPAVVKAKQSVTADKPTQLNTSMTAKRLINTKDLSREDWLQVRKQGIGSSDAAAACGIHPYLSMLELWMIKTGRMSSDIDESIEGYSPLYWGNTLEPMVAKYYQEHTGNKVRRVNAILQHPEQPFMLANLDYAITGSGEVQILECKTAGEHGAKLWKHGVPLYVTCQVQHQLAVTGKTAAHICVLLCGHEAKIYKVERDERLIESIMEHERQFWQYVQTDTPPTPDHSESAAKALKLLYPTPKPSSKVDLRDDDGANKLFEQLLSYRDYMQELEQRHDQVKHQLQTLIAANEVAVFEKGTISWKRSKDSIGLDSKAVIKAHPELLAKFSKTKQGSRRFVILND
ncbi:MULTISPECIES: YqaJ viral recombinase family protein [unclassified Psychrobacter]|uniref:YqaJ viral recombinase family nuclease n=1 Tax=unclassified Psychrobacter TaxID=196806 RepID=UPI000868B378|nr:MULTISPECIES: YqaJ viral recombinase family protein [unclassified Psychrobacter]OEH69141.1 MAG: YqaJ-like viral recombinase [Psychrobacter sp. B29-1]PKG65858.1 YqaJ-like viral recombinase [Psychrobacter sp. Choline-02u-13]PKH48332.1 YqaJ-like viral recombinase [Psychrobacter sp. Choline-02u-9]|tara:strand:- start:33033 stop:34130 length:1098 start_codon:yes stop_codon:yes gene_type:complete